MMTDTHLNREEYVEQAYFFHVYRERLEQNLPSQEILVTIGEEVLATTRLPIALDVLRGEMLLTGRISDGMSRLPHYFRPFQTFVLSQAEEDRSRFDQKIALLMLEREAEYLSGSATPAGLFIYQFECIARNRLGYDAGLTAVADDPMYDADWRDWIHQTRLSLGTRDFAERIYYRSEYFIQQRRRQTGRPAPEPARRCFFGEQEGRIAWANRGKDPLFLFAALQRQLGYPSVPRARATRRTPTLHPALEQRLQRIEKRLQILESDVKGEFDLSDFYAQPPDFSNPDNDIPPSTNRSPTVE